MEYLYLEVSTKTGRRLRALARKKTLRAPALAATYIRERLDLEDAKRKARKAQR